MSCIGYKTCVVYLTKSTESRGIMALVSLCFLLRDARVKMDYNKIATLVNVSSIINSVFTHVHVCIMIWCEHSPC